MSSRNYVLARIMHMGDHVMVEPSIDPNLLGFNLVAKILVKLTEGVSVDTVTGGVSAWANTWEIASKVLFSFARRVEGQGKVARMRMEDAKLIARGEVLYTGMVVEWETREMTGAPQWRSLFADKLVELKSSMELVWGETKEGAALLNPELVFRVRRHESEEQGESWGLAWDLWVVLQEPGVKVARDKSTHLGLEVSSASFTNIPPNMSNQSRLVQIYVASKPKKSSFALVDHTSAFNRAVHELIRLSAIAPPLLGGHALLPTASVESTNEWRCEWEIWMGALLRALGDAKEEGDQLEIPYDVVQAIATAEAAYMNLESQAEADRDNGNYNDTASTWKHSWRETTPPSIPIHLTMSLELFTMITEKPEVTQAHVEFRAATEALKATVLTTPDKDMPEEQETWCLKWRQRLAVLTKALGAEPLKGLGLGVKPADGLAFMAAHNTCTRWETAIRAREQAKKEREEAASRAREEEEERQ
ncbi:hypothetical protein BDN67DRAFT_985373 [Paxillus ammoniavirescens]|nr:hypothetical protein BDN67DRAFT_985373 [Paxillus ammoniavirescens]